MIRRVGVYSEAFRCSGSVCDHWPAVLSIQQVLPFQISLSYGCTSIHPWLHIYHPRLHIHPSVAVQVSSSSPSMRHSHRTSARASPTSFSRRSGDMFQLNASAYEEYMATRCENTSALSHDTTPSILIFSLCFHCFPDPSLLRCRTLTGVRNAPELSKSVRILFGPVFAE